MLIKNTPVIKIYDIFKIYDKKKKKGFKGTIRFITDLEIIPPIFTTKIRSDRII